MLELGGQVLGFDPPTQLRGGASVTDTVRTVGCYADIIAMRHPRKARPWPRRESFVPVINAGDGGTTTTRP